jgi:hypothetical protein
MFPKGPLRAVGRPTSGSPTVARPLQAGVMPSAWRLILPWSLITAVTVGCSGVRVPVARPVTRLGDRLENAEVLASTGRYAAARETYTAVLTDPEELGRDRALLGLARLALDPQNPNKNDRQAAEYLERLLREYPDGCCAAEARTWQNLLRNVARLQQDARRFQQELERIRRDLQRAQQEAVRLQGERERLRHMLRQIDAELEYPRSTESAPTPVRIPPGHKTTE